MGLKVSGNVTHEQTGKHVSLTTPYLLIVGKDCVLGWSRGLQLTDRGPFVFSWLPAASKLNLLSTLKNQEFLLRYLDDWFLIKKHKIWQNGATIQHNNNKLGFSSCYTLWVWHEPLSYPLHSSMSPTLSQSRYFLFKSFLEFSSHSKHKLYSG